MGLGGEGRAGCGGRAGAARGTPSYLGVCSRRRHPRAPGPPRTPEGPGPGAPAAGETGTWEGDGADPGHHCRPRCVPGGWLLHGRPTETPHEKPPAASVQGPPTQPGQSLLLPCCWSTRGPSGLGVWHWAPVPLRGQWGHPDDSPLRVKKGCPPQHAGREATASVLLVPRVRATDASVSYAPSEREIRRTGPTPPPGGLHFTQNRTIQIYKRNKSQKT